MYHNGVGVPEDMAEAAKWYRLAANQGLVHRAVQPRACCSVRASGSDGRTGGDATFCTRRRRRATSRRAARWARCIGSATASRSASPSPPSSMSSRHLKATPPHLAVSPTTRPRSRSRPSVEACSLPSALPRCTTGASGSSRTRHACSRGYVGWRAREPGTTIPTCGTNSIDMRDFYALDPFRCRSGRWLGSSSARCGAAQRPSR